LSAGDDVVALHSRFLGETARLDLTDDEAFSVVKPQLSCQGRTDGRKHDAEMPTFGFLLPLGGIREAEPFPQLGIAAGNVPNGYQLVQVVFLHELGVLLLEVVHRRRAIGAILAPGRTCRLSPAR
jgi:hypothetical protein